MATYVEQVQRLLRTFERFREIHDGRVHDRESDHYGDEMYGFFLNCYHLKDWLINDPSFQATSADVEGFVDSHVELQVCADICNAHKHFRLDRPRSTQQPSMGSRKFFLNIGGGPTQISVHYTIDTASGPVEAFDLATRCRDLWLTFIRGRGGAV